MTHNKLQKNFRIGINAELPPNDNFDDQPDDFNNYANNYH